MRVVTSCAALVAFVLVINNLVLYCYPFLRGASYLIPFGRPPLRMLILADPHIEGDAKITRMGWRGMVDIWGNDHYLGHIHRVMSFFTRPTHTAILGDHMSSQWIDDVEFFKRSKRLETRVFRWKSGEQMFNITGNHDIGWQVQFGPANFVTPLDTERLEPGSAELRVVVMNNLHLDGPALEEDLRRATQDFLQAIPKDGTTTILLTHIPLHKNEGICVDAPLMSYYDKPQVLLREQNHLSLESSKAILDQLYETGDGIVMTGHDHEGCHTLHAQPAERHQFWKASRFTRKNLKLSKASKVKVIEEVTVRSVMGQYSGNSGLLTGRYDRRQRNWKFHYQAVPFMHNTGWWVIHIINMIAFSSLLSYILLRLLADQMTSGFRTRHESRSSRIKTRTW